MAQLKQSWQCWFTGTFQSITGRRVTIQMDQMTCYLGRKSRKYSEGTPVNTRPG